MTNGSTTDNRRKRAAAIIRIESIRRSLGVDPEDIDTGQKLPDFGSVDTKKGADPPTNDDEDNFGEGVNFFASYSKGLPRDNWNGSEDIDHSKHYGEVDSDEFIELRDGIESPTSEDFDNVSENDDGRLLSNPEAATSYAAYGFDPNDVWGPKPPAFDDPVTGAEMIELYWMAILRDVRFSAYSDNDDAQEAAEELAHEFSKASGEHNPGSDDTDRLPPLYDGPTDDTGDPDPEKLFRDDLPGVDRGPYISQFLLRDFTRGIRERDNRQRSYVEGEDFITEYETWLRVQAGEEPDETPSRRGDEDGRHIITGRDLATFVRRNNSPQQFLNAAFFLQGLDDGPPLDDGLADDPEEEDDPAGRPVKGSVADTFVDYGRSEYQAVIAGIHNTHLRAAWYHKWRLHRRLRPEEYGGRVFHADRDTQIDDEPADERYPIPPNLRDSTALDEHKDRFDTALLSQAYGVGSPTHPSYPAGHGVSAGALATILKAFFDEEWKFTDPKKAVENDDGSTELQSIDPDEPLTIESEANKLAANTHLGRNFAGIHYRSDGVAGMRIGERVAIGYLSDVLANKNPELYDGSRGEFEFTPFDADDGETVTVTAAGTEDDGLLVGPAIYESDTE